jgi:hypothetical protein
MHACTQKQFNEIRDQRFTLITFENGRRKSTYGGLGISRLLTEINKANRVGFEYLILTEEEALKIDISQWDKRYFYSK